MGSNSPIYLGETIIANFDRPKVHDDISTDSLITREARNHGLSLHGVHSTPDGETETVRIGVEDARENRAAVDAFQRSISLFFRFNGFQQVAVERASERHPGWSSVTSTDATLR